ncbi:hypothetical protein C8C95_3505 [Acidovorax sp. 99]|nr:hypothetical protein C8C95_3505 [Acidovorax sp. 99]
MPLLRAEAGSRPGGRGTFLCFAKEKYPKERRPPVCDPCASLRGKPVAGRLRGAPWNSLCAGARRSDIHGESVHEAWALRRPCHPATAPPQAQPAGVDNQTSNSRTATRAIAALGPAFAARGACAREIGPSKAMARMDVRFAGSLLDAPGARRARGGMRVGARMLRELTHRSCPSGAPQARSEFCGAPRDRAPQVAPPRSEGVADSRVALSLVPFFRRRERKGLARRGDIPASALNPSTPPKPENELPPAPTSSARTGRRAPITIKTIAASAYSKSASSQNRSKIPFHHPFNHPLNLPTPSPNLPRS